MCMGEQITIDDLTVEQIETAYEVLEVVRENHREENRDGMATTVNEAHYLVQQYEQSVQWVSPHTHNVGEYVIDDYEPTPSPEVNTVRVVELFNQRADEFVVDEETGKTVADCENNRFYPDDDLVVAGVYPNMGDPDKVWHFPESRLR